MFFLPTWKIIKSHTNRTFTTVHTPCLLKYFTRARLSHEMSVWSCHFMVFFFFINREYYLLMNQIRRTRRVDKSIITVQSVHISRKSLRVDTVVTFVWLLFVVLSTGDFWLVPLVLLLLLCNHLSVITVINLYFVCIYLIYIYIFLTKYQTTKLKKIGVLNYINVNRVIKSPKTIRSISPD